MVSRMASMGTCMYCAMALPGCVGPSDQSRNENALGHVAQRCCGTSSYSGEVVVVSSGHPLDHADLAQAAKLA